MLLTSLHPSDPPTLHHPPSTLHPVLGGPNEMGGVTELVRDGEHAP